MGRQGMDESGGEKDSKIEGGDASGTEWKDEVEERIGE